MKNDPESLLASLVAWGASLAELIRHLGAADKKASSEAVLILLLQGLHYFDGPDSPVMEQFGPVLDVIKKRIHTEDFEGALRQARSFETQFEEVKLMVRKGLESMEKPDEPTAKVPRDPSVGIEGISTPAQRLSALPEIQDRIDEVARDLNSGEHLYAAVDPVELGELLGLDWDDTGGMGWSGRSLGHRVDLPESPGELAELLLLLADKIPAPRYQKLDQIAEQILVQGVERKLPLTKKELVLLCQLYSEQEAQNGHTFGLAEISLRATDGTLVHFQTLIGDAGDLEDQAGPYEHVRGLFLDPSKYIVIDEY